MYKQKKFDELVTIAKDIVKIHEDLDGVDSLESAHALTNLGSVSNRLQLKDLCDIAERRALYIFENLYGKESKEVLRQRGRMLTFQLNDAQTVAGLTYRKYQNKMNQFNSKLTDDDNL